MEPRGLKRVRRFGSGRRHQPVGSVSGVVRCGRQGGGAEGPAPATAVSAPGSVGDQGDPLAPAATRCDDLHGSVGIQHFQDNICVVCLRTLRFLHAHEYYTFNV